MKVVINIFLMCIISSCICAKQPLTIHIDNKDEYERFYSSSYSSKIKFDIEDYIGAWRDSIGRNDDFKLNKDLSIELDWIKGKCEKVEQYNNILLLKCFGKFGILKDDINQYVKIQIFYYPDEVFDINHKLSQKINISMDYDKECALSNYGENNVKCESPNLSYDMYYKIKDDEYRDYTED